MQKTSTMEGQQTGDYNHNYISVPSWTCTTRGRRHGTARGRRHGGDGTGETATTTTRGRLQPQGQLQPHPQPQLPMQNSGETMTTTTTTATTDTTVTTMNFEPIMKAFDFYFVDRKLVMSYWLSMSVKCRRKNEILAS